MVFADIDAPPRSHRGVEDASLHSIPVGVARIDRLRAMASAAEVVVRTMAELAARGTHVVADLLVDSDDHFVEWAHYPADDARDATTGGRYFYHTHAGHARTASEHGHFHLFLDRAGVRRSLPSVPDPRDRNRDTADLVHLVAIAMDAFGQPLALFTTNRWVTNETWYPAADVIAALDQFTMSSPDAASSRWMTGMVQLFRPEIEALLHERDSAVLAWAKRYPKAFVLEDRRLEVTSIVPVALADHVRALAERLERRAPASGRDKNELCPLPPNG